MIDVSKMNGYKTMKVHGCQDTGGRSTYPLSHLTHSLLYDNGPVNLRQSRTFRMTQKRSQLVSSSIDNEAADLLWQCVDDENKEEREDGEDDQSNDILLVFLPDKEDEGLQWIDEPAEAGGGTTGEKTGDSLHLFTPLEIHSKQQASQKNRLIPVKKLSFIV